MPPTPNQDPTRGNAGTFKREIARRLGRALTMQEGDAAQAVDRLFHVKDAALVSEALVLAALGERAPSWMWQTIALWQAPPQTAWETWLHVAEYSRTAQRPMLPSFSEATPWEEVDALFGDQRRREAVRVWSERLANLAARAQPAAAEKAHELRMRLMGEGARLEWKKNGAGEFKAVSEAAYAQLQSAQSNGRLPVEGASRALWQIANTGYGSTAFHRYADSDCARVLNALLRRDELAALVVGPSGQPLQRATERLAWRVEVREEKQADYRLALVRPDGTPPPRALTILEGDPALYVTADTIFESAPVGGLGAAEVELPAEAVETPAGVALFERIATAPPARMAQRIRVEKLRPVFCCRLETSANNREQLFVEIFAEGAEGTRVEFFGVDGWQPIVGRKIPASEEGRIVQRDRTALALADDAIALLKLVAWPYKTGQWHRQAGRNFPERFTEWLESLPASAALELDADLATLRGPAIAARVKLEVEENGIDWFDLQIALDVADTTLTKAELKALLDARGGFVRLGAKGWRRLAFEMSPEDEAQLADLGLDARDFTGEKQRLHALQLAGKAKHLLPEPAARAIEKRVAEIRTRVAPELPAGLRAELRPYQREGYHFLAYLSTNRFGGILADDMGLGKTVQALAWLLWLREQDESARRHPVLVVAPKSVVDNWRTEAERFAPELRVHAIERGANSAGALEDARKDSDIVVLNYANLRGLEKALVSAPWSAVILDEAQAIKNPTSNTARAAWALDAPHRLALSGTPIENRLLDLWSIMAFAMPGVLGPRAKFARSFDSRSDPLARRRLAARVRPFVLRRTKGEVATDLPDRIEEDLICEMEGPQLTLYRAELKRARAALLGLKSKGDLDKARFNILTSLLRLRQICCHPGLASGKATEAESAKLNALLDVVEPLMEEGHKVLIFSQFVEMLLRIETALGTLLGDRARLFKLTGETENRGDLVREFQGHQGAAAFLISLRAGGFGLNLTAASYVVLFDPWWNPAVENQAIDRTHRIGQVNKVIAYRLIVKESIEEKIRTLQKQKSALAADILGEENFARALTITDFEFLFSE